MRRNAFVNFAVSVMLPVLAGTDKQRSSTRGRFLQEIQQSTAQHSMAHHGATGVSTLQH
jgi:hypothetical protein